MLLAPLVGFCDVGNASFNGFGNGTPHALHIVSPQEVIESDFVACNVRVNRVLNGSAYAVVGFLLLDAVTVVGGVVVCCFRNEIVYGS